MVRTTKHNISKYTNDSKLSIISKMFTDYRSDLICYIRDIVSGDLPLVKRLSSNEKTYII